MMLFFSDVVFFCVAFGMGALAVHILCPCDNTHFPKLHCDSCGETIAGLNLTNNRSVCPECGSENVAVLVHYILRDTPEPMTIDIPIGK